MHHVRRSRRLRGLGDGLDAWRAWLLSTVVTARSAKAHFRLQVKPLSLSPKCRPQYPQFQMASSELQSDWLLRKSHSPPKEA